MQVHEQYEQLRTKTMPQAALVIGGVSEKAQIQGLRAGSGLVIATPGRLQDLMNRRFADLRHVKILVLDEADRMLDMGFAPQLNRIVAEIPPYRQTLLFSATMPPEVEALARKYLRKPVVVQVGRRSEAASTVTHAVYPVPRDRKSTLLVELLKEANMDSVLIFTRTKHGADRVVSHLEDQGIAATAMHADKSQGERTRALEDFKSGKIRVLVATDIAARGIDVTALGQKAVDIHAQRAASIQDRSRDPGFAASLNILLKSLLQTILLGSAEIGNLRRQEPETANCCLNPADAFEIV